MISVIITVASVFVIAAMFILYEAVSEKPGCSIIITPLSPESTARLIASSYNAKPESIYIITESYDEKYFSHLKKHYLIKEVLTVVCRDN